MNPRGAIWGIEMKIPRSSKEVGMRLVTLARVTAVLLAVASAPAVAGVGEGELDAAEIDAAEVDAPEVDAPEVDKPHVDAPETDLDMGRPHAPSGGDPAWVGPGSNNPAGSPAWVGPGVADPAPDQPVVEPLPREPVSDLLPPEDDGVVHEYRETDVPGLD
jgi:hypothetical protein